MTDFIGNGLGLVDPLPGLDKPATQDLPLEKSVVFGVGMPLTGGAQLAKALEILGYKTRVGGGWGRKLAIAYLNYGDWRILRQWARGGHRAWVDWPHHCYRRLHGRYPDARWILTTRDVEAWLAEWREHIVVMTKRVHRQGVAALFEANRNLFGTGLPSAGLSEEVFHQYFHDVRDFLDGQDKTWLEIDLSDGGDWPVLCAMLGEDVPSEPFPGTIE